MKFSDLEKSFRGAGIRPEDYPSALSEAEPFIPLNEIPEQLIERMQALFRQIEWAKMSLPFVHITSKEIVDSNGRRRSTGFVEQIEQDGLKVNTNGSAFVRRSREENPKVAEADYFIERPDQFLEDLRLIAEKYLHHGVRTNKRLLGHGGKGNLGRYTEGRGIPVMFLFDRTGVPLYRGVDGDEHYVLDKPLKRDRMISLIPLENLNLQDKQTLIMLASQVIEATERYVDAVSPAVEEAA